MKIEQDIKLDFQDVLLVPQRSTIQSRADVKLIREFQFYHSPKIWTGIPIMISNMDFVTIDLIKKACEHYIVTCIPKSFDIDTIVSLFKNSPGFVNYAWISIGYKKEDVSKLKVLKEFDINICIDVPNGQIDCFVDYCKQVREQFPNAIIMAGNVTDPSSTQELIIHGGADIVKCGIGPGCFIAGTKIVTKKGKKNIEKINIGDLVLTHTGKFHKVTGLSTRIENHRIIDINGIKCTENHEFYVVHKNNSSKINNHNIHKYAKWISAADLSEDYYLIKLQT